jgi:mono/diheme cytochrome c family protein
MLIKKHPQSLTLGSILLIGLPILAAAFADKKQSRAESWASALNNAPAEAASRPNPYEARAEAAQAGRKLFRRHCEECHGPEACGSTTAPSLRSGPVRDAAPGTLYWFLTNGNLKHGMPSWSGLPNQQRWQLVCYLKSLGSQERQAQATSAFQLHLYRHP